MELELHGAVFEVEKYDYDAFQDEAGKTVPGGTSVTATVLDLHARKVRKVKIPAQHVDSLDLTPDAAVDWIVTAYARQNRMTLTYSRPC